MEQASLLGIAAYEMEDIWLLGSPAMELPAIFKSICVLFLCSDEDDLLQSSGEELQS